VGDVSKLVLVARQRSDSIKRRVARVLEEHQCARGDDRLLAFYYWRTFNGLTMSCKQYNHLFDVIRSAPSADTITRRRRELLAEGRNDLRPSEGTLLKRCKRELVFREFYAQKPLTDFERED
jgi:hypothetical protein